MTYLVVGRAIAERATAIRLDLHRRVQHVNERVLDSLMAATVLEYDPTLATRNTRDYHDIAGLRPYR